MIKILFKTIFTLVFFILTIESRIAAADPSCPVSGGIFLTNGDQTTGHDCKFKPDIQIIELQSLQLCTAQPVLPTTSTSMSSQSDCSDSISPGQLVTVSNAGSALSGPITKPSNNHYSYAIIKLNPLVKLKSKGQWDATMIGAAGGPGGIYCWSTNPGTIYMHGFKANTAIGSPTPAAECGPSENSTGTYALTSIFVNSLTYDSFLTSNTGSSSGYSSLPLSFYLIQSDGMLPSSGNWNATNGITSVVIITQVSIDITDQTSSISLMWNNDNATDAQNEFGAALGTIAAFVPNKLDYAVTSP